MMKIHFRYVRRAAILFFLEASAMASGSLTAKNHLQAYSPSLVALYDGNLGQIPMLQKYATTQGFVGAHEQLAVITHELVHIESARLGAYWVSGQPYQGYQASTWPDVTAGQLSFSLEEKGALGGIYDNYVTRNPAITLKNVVDEVNAYSQTAGFVCEYEGAVADKQTKPLLSHLALANAFLKAYTPPVRQSVCTDPVSKGILALVVKNSYKTLAACGIFRIPEQNFIRDCLQ